MHTLQPARSESWAHSMVPKMARDVQHAPNMNATKPAADLATSTDATLADLFTAWQEQLRSIRNPDDRLAMTRVLMSINGEQARRAG